MKIIHLLKSLQSEEYKDFEKFLQSPFFKFSEQYLKFFRHLCKQHPTFYFEKNELEIAYRRCFGPESLTDSRLNNLLSGMGKQIEQYLAVRMILAPDSKEGTNALYEQLLVKSLGLRNAGSYFRTEAKQLADEINARPLRDSEDYLALSQLHHQVYFNPDTPKFQEYPPYLQLATEQLDWYYYLAKLRYAAEMNARERILNVQYDMPLLEEILEKTASPAFIDTHPLLAIYHQLVSLYQAEIQEPDFRAMKAVFLDKFTVLPKVDQVLLLRYLINIGIGLIVRDIDVDEDMLALYKLGIDTDILLDGNRITHIGFSNIAALASFQKDFDWLQTFISRFSPFLEEPMRQPSVDLAHSYLYYNQGLLEKAHASLTPEIYSIQSMDLMGKILLVKIVFDRYILFGKDYEFLKIQLTGFEKFIQTKPLTKEKKYAYLNFTRFIRKMVVIKSDMVVISESKRESLRKKLKQPQPCMGKKWLMQRIEML